MLVIQVNHFLIFLFRLLLFLLQIVFTSLRTQIQMRVSTLKSPTRLRVFLLCFSLLSSHLNNGLENGKFHALGRIFFWIIRKVLSVEVRHVLFNMQQFKICFCNFIIELCTKSMLMELKINFAFERFEEWLCWHCHHQRVAAKTHRKRRDLFEFNFIGVSYK